MRGEQIIIEAVCEIGKKVSAAHDVQVMHFVREGPS